MEITSDRTDNILTILLSGRLDAFGAKQLDEALKKFITDHDSAVVIDMEDVSYLSSGGIRTFLVIEKMLKKRDGGIRICNLNPYPLKVLEMAGFDQFFSIYSSKEDAIKSCITREAMRRSKVDWDRLPRYNKFGARFTVFEASQKEAVLKVAGDISKVLYARLGEEDILSRRFSKTEYSIGLGALGMSVNDCMPFLGEMITIGGTMVWLPTDGNDTPDFLIPKRDTGDVTIHTGFNVALDGTFNDIIVGECVGWNNTCERITQKLHPDCSEVRLTPISGGYSGSLVFKANAWDRSGRKEMLFVLKIDKWSAINDEIRGYTEHVKRYIQNNATQIIQHCKLGDFGGILYNFVGIKGTMNTL